MAFQLKPEESVRKGLRRVLRKQLDAAINELATKDVSGAAVYGARKHIKKARAIVRLVEPAIEIKKATHGLRHAGRLLSRIRDAKAVVDDADKLFGSRPVLSRHTRDVLREVLQRRKARAHRAARRHHATGRAHALLVDVRRRVDTWDWSDVTKRQFEAAVQHSYKRARRGMPRTGQASDPVAFHEWRKRVKHLLYALRLVEHTSPEIGRQVAQLRRMETWLGDDHNLAVFSARVIGKLPFPHDAMRVATLIEGRHARLTHLALKAGGIFFKEKPKSFGKRFRRLHRETLVSPRSQRREAPVRRAA